VLYRGNAGLIAHECIVDFRAWKKHGLEVEDAAKRLMDYGYHAPTMSFPVPGTLMIEPTESEAKAELDRFCDAMIAIHGEMQAVVNGRVGQGQQPAQARPAHREDRLRRTWDRPYSADHGGLPGPLHPREQVLARRRPRRQRPWRPQPGVLVRGDGTATASPVSGGKCARCSRTALVPAHGIVYAGQQETTEVAAPGAPGRRRLRGKEPHHSSSFSSRPRRYLRS
jgi:hypothetical protein